MFDEFSNQYLSLPVQFPFHIFRGEKPFQWRRILFVSDPPRSSPKSQSTGCQMLLLSRSMRTSLQELIAVPKVDREGEGERNREIKPTMAKRVLSSLTINLSWELSPNGQKHARWLKKCESDGGTGIEDASEGLAVVIASGESWGVYFYLPDEHTWERHVRQLSG